jgi:hypothetical protein
MAKLTSMEVELRGTSAIVIGIGIGVTPVTAIVTGYETNIHPEPDGIGIESMDTAHPSDESDRHQARSRGLNRNPFPEGRSAGPGLIGMGGVELVF